MLSWIVATCHLLAFAIAFAAVLLRGSLARANPDDPRRVFVADAIWIIAAAIVIATGLWRAFGHLEKGADFYIHESAFRIKMTLVAALLLLEIAPMRLLFAWRRSRAIGRPFDHLSARRIALISHMQSGIMLLIVIAATAMARGIGF